MASSGGTAPATRVHRQLFLDRQGGVKLQVHSFGDSCNGLHVTMSVDLASFLPPTFTRASNSGEVGAAPGHTSSEVKPKRAQL